MTSPAAIEVRGVQMAYDETVALRDVTVEIPTGCLVGVVGPNGAGKSTLIKGLVGAREPDRGELRFFGKPATKKRPFLTYVPQRGAVDWDFPITAEGVVRQGRFRSVGLLTRFSAEERGKVEAAMEAVDITALRSRQIGNLSGGQQQRVFLARALCQGGEIYVLDEPFAGVDASTESAIMDVLRGLRDEGKTVVVVHHDLSTVREYFDRLILLNQVVVAAGPTEEVFTAENLQETYRGQVAVVVE